MPVTIQINGTTLSFVHKFSNGISIATIPDVCKTPSPGGPVPIPYPNIAQSIMLSDGTTTVKGDKIMAANKGSKFALSNGDNAGVAGGVKSSTFMKEATWILYSFDVKVDGKNACRFTDKMFHNAENTVNLTGEMQQPVPSPSLVDAVGAEYAQKICEAICNAKKNKTPDGKYEDAVAEHFSHGAPDYKPKDPRMLAEVFQKVEKGGGQLETLLSRSGRTLFPRGGPLAPASLFSGLGQAAALRATHTVIRWDLVLLKNPTGGLGMDNVEKLIEIKFDDNLTNNQRAVLSKMDPKTYREKVHVVLAHEDCSCPE